MAASQEWKLVHTFGEKRMEDLVDADVLSAVEFSDNGDFFATGDRGGRVRIYEKSLPLTKPAGGAASPKLGATLKGTSGGPIRTGPPEYRLRTEFKSHEPEFDYLKSVEIEEKINCVRWCNRMGGSNFLVTTNDKTIKLWRISSGGKAKSLGTLSNGGMGSPSMPSMRAPPSAAKIPTLRYRSALTPDSVKCTPRRTFMNGHAYHINSISLNSDQENFISADDLRINLWNLDVHDTSFNVVDIKPANMEELTEVITAAVCHPIHCNIFLWSNSRGSVKLADMRSSALCDAHSKVFEEEEDPSRRSFFSEIISSISDVKFSEDGRYILSRDYMSLKLWDVNMEARPLKTINVHEQLRSRLCDLYENDSIFDKFQCALSGDGTAFVTGSYNNQFHIYERNSRNDVCIEANKNPKKKAPTKSKLSLGRSKREDAAGDQRDFEKKCLHVSWHPRHNCIAVAALNTVCVYHGSDNGRPS